MIRGRVIQFDARRGYGKIRGPRFNAFVHKVDLVDVLALHAGQHVEFEVLETERGPRAITVRPLGPEPWT